MEFEEFFEKYCTNKVIFLQNHKQIAKLIYEHIKNQGGDFAEISGYKYGSFDWSYTDEGHHFWRNVIIGEDVDMFYLKYPKIKTCKLD